MNIFFTSHDADECARVLDDKRVIKMALETTQILSTVLHKHGIEVLYRPTHANHPCAVWAGQTRGNFAWLLDHGFALINEYEARFDKDHACLKVLLELAPHRVVLPPGEFGWPPNCTPYKDAKDVTLAYRWTLNDKWRADSRKPKWTRSCKPFWADADIE